ncbi:tetratricopeptide repeat protein [Deferrisoma palaeochoriense]
MPDVRFLFHLIERHALDEDWPSVLRLLERVREHQPEPETAEDAFFLSFHEGMALLETGDPAGAVGVLQEAARHDPEHISARLLLADALLRSERGEEACAELEDALRQAPDHPGCLCALGWVLYQQNRKTEGKRVLERAARLHPYYPPAHIDLGLILASEARWDEAEFHLEAALALTPEDPELEAALRAVREGRAGRALERQQMRALLPEIRAQRRILRPEERAELRRLRAWLRSKGASHLEVLLVEGVWAEVAQAGSAPRVLDAAWAAALAWTCHRMLGHEVSRAEVAEHWGISVSTLAKRYAAVRRLFDEADRWPRDEAEAGEGDPGPAGAVIPVDFQNRQRLPLTSPCPCGSGMPVESCTHTTRSKPVG